MNDNDSGWWWGMATGVLLACAAFLMLHLQ